MDNQDKKLESEIIEDVKAGLRDGITPGVVVIPLGIAYGILAHDVGITLMQTAALSVTVCAGAAQIAVLNLISYGAGLPQMVAAVALINARLALHSAVISRYLRDTSRLWFPFLSFGIATVSFGMVVARGEKYRRVEAYMLCLNLTFILLWTLASLAGFVLPGILPPDLQGAITFALPALLIGMVVNLVSAPGKASAMAAGYFIAIISGVLALALYLVSPSWSLPLAAVIGGTVGAVVKRGKP